MYKLVFVEYRDEKASWNNIKIDSQKLMYQASMVIDCYGYVIKNRHCGNDISAHIDITKIEYGKEYSYVIVNDKSEISETDAQYADFIFKVEDQNIIKILKDPYDVFVSHIYEGIPRTGVPLSVNGHNIRLYNPVTRNQMYRVEFTDANVILSSADLRAIQDTFFDVYYSYTKV